MPYMVDQSQKVAKVQIDACTVQRYSRSNLWSYFAGVLSYNWLDSVELNYYASQRQVA